MKKLSNLLAALVFVSLVIFISCSSDSTPAPDPLADQAALLLDTWTATNVGYISGGVPDVSWTDAGSVFTINITNATASGGNYTVSNVPTGFEAVWPTNGGSWTFNNTTGSQLLRSDGVVINVTNLTETTVTLSFDITNGRVPAGINGDWTFTMSGN